MPPDGYVSVAEAATRLGIHPRSVRKRIEAGTIQHVREGQAYFVLIDTATEPEQETPEPDAKAEDDPDGGGAIAVPPAGTPAPLNLEPIADLIQDLTRQLREADQAAAMWQERARQLELQNEKLLALDSGPIIEVPQRPWWRRIFGG